MQIFIAQMPDLYNGLCAVGHTEAGALDALKAGYNRMKASLRLDFEAAYDSYGGSVRQVEVGVACDHDWQPIRYER